MSIIDHDSTVMVKTREYCTQIASDPMFLKLQASIECFLNDDTARIQYQKVNALGEDLNQKQQAGIQLGASEIREFEDARDALLEKDVAREFLEAQRGLESLQKEIRLYIGLTLELGHVPTADDLAEASHGGGSCCGGSGGGSGCGCSC
ncbi:MAG: YlbF family regulator [Verrucomicrobia bacterium]|nr:YlbF family regulator [Verrucomicrobiota bacterium]